MASLRECRQELNQIIAELESIEYGLRVNFKGIGNDLCADCVSKVIDKYRGVKKRLDRVDQNRLADWVNKD